MENRNLMNWVRSDDPEYKQWKDGFTPSQLMDRNASGSSAIGQLADLYSTHSNADWVVSQCDTFINPGKLHREKVSSDWEAVVIQIVVDETATEKEQLRTTAEKLDYIKDSFGISLSHLAKILRTSRPSLYSWLNGEEPREGTVRRIQQINEYAERWAKLNQYHFSPGPLFRQPLGKGPSMLERLMRDELNMAEIDAGISAMLELMQRRRERMDRSKQKTQGSSVSEKESAQNRHALTKTVGTID